VPQFLFIAPWALQKTGKRKFRGISLGEFSLAYETYHTRILFFLKIRTYANVFYFLTRILEPWCNHYCFVPLAVETSEAPGEEAAIFFRDVGRRIAVATDELLHSLSFYSMSEYRHPAWECRQCHRNCLLTAASRCVSFAMF